MKTRKQLTALLLIFCSATLFARDRNTLTNDDLFTWNGNGAYGAIDYTWSDVNGEMFAVSGGRGTFIVDHNFGLGFGIYSADRISSVEGEIAEMDYGGLNFEFYNRPDKLIFPSFKLFSGLAVFDDAANDNNALWFVEPGAGLWLNVASFMRISLNSSYRIFQEDETMLTPPLKGLNFGFSIAYGKF